MLIQHCWKKNEIKKNSSDALGFLLTNGLGGYLSLPNKIASRYHGWFFTTAEHVGKKLFKVIENIELQEGDGQGGVLEIKNNFWNIERVYNNNVENFFLPKNHNSLVYELNKAGKIILFLDTKESYDNQEFGRFYEVFEEKNILVIKCQNNQDFFYLAIRADQLNYSKIGDWVLRNYELDKKRGSRPFERYVYRALEMIGVQKIIFSVNQNKEKAIKEAIKLFNRTEKLKKIEEKRVGKIFNNIVSQKAEVNFAYWCAKSSLNDLMVSRQQGFYAGLPWFFQFWSRDELISLGALDKKIQKRILLKQFNNLEKIKNLDSLGWLFYRAGKMLTDRKVKKLFFKFMDSFDIVDADITWMDTLSRPKAIELYALKLAMYKLDYKNPDKEKKLLKYARKNFWKKNEKILADLPNSFIVRPNIFLTAYIYPELLSKREWIACFENCLNKLWLDWGGVATVDKTSSLFVGHYTGEEAKSYHNGDSWFWVNNLTALVLAKLDKKRFSKYIEKILEASTNEILWKGVIGHHGEISSAEEFRSEGCWSQLWSNALYVELIDYCFGKNS